jgi:hypothetical protein
MSDKEYTDHLAAESEVFSFLQWTPVWCGAIVAAALSFVLLSFGSALGLAVASPSTTWRDASATLSLLSGVWLLLSSLTSFGLAGYLSGRLQAPRGAVDSHEIEFRDGVHGLLAWGLAIIIGILLTFATVRAIAAGGITDTSKAMTSTVEPLMALELDQLFRSDRKLTDPGDAEIRAQAGRIIASGLGHTSIAADDRAYLVSMVETRSGLTPSDADSRVTQVIAKAQETVRKARRVGVILAFMVAASLMMGAAIAWLAAVAGGRHRGGDAAPNFWRRWEVDRMFIIR